MVGQMGNKTEIVIKNVNMKAIHSIQGRSECQAVYDWEQTRRLVRTSGVD